MVRSKQIRVFLLTTALAAVFSGSARAQYPYYEPPRWRVTGFAGFNLTHTSQGQTNLKTHTDQLFPLGDLRLKADGFLLDPRFLHINAGVDYQKGANTSERGDLGLGGINAAITTSFLPNSHIPLRVTYTRTSHGVTGLGLDQSNDDSRLDVQWNVFRPNLPHMVVSFQDYNSTVHVPTSFADRTFSQKAFNTGLSDTWKDWQWSGNFSVASGSSSGIGQLGPDSSFDDFSRAGLFNLYRGFWDNKARLRFENREIWRDQRLAGDGSSNSRELGNNATLNLQVHPKVALSAGYGFTQVEFENNGLINTPVPGGGPIQVVSLFSSTSNSFTGQVDYHPFGWLRLTQDVRNILLTPLNGVAESQTSFTDTASTVEADHHWRSFDLMGAYTGRFQMTGTSLDRTPNSWSNSFIGRVGWGDVRRVRLVGSAQDTHLNLVTQIGGFSDEKRVGLTAETHRVKYFRLHAGGDYSQVELLNSSGNTHSKMVIYSAAADHRLFTLSYTNSFMDGAGALFPLGLVDHQFLVIPLPLSQLVATPLLNRTAHAQTVTFLGRPRRRLEASVAWRTEDTVLVASEQTYNVLQADARYHIGKFTLEGGYSRNLNDVTIVTGVTGTRLAIWYLRIGRDFKVF